MSYPYPLHFRLNSTCNNISKPSRSNLRDPKLYNFLGEHPEIPPKSSVLHMIEFFPSLIINPVSNPAGILLQINKNQICNMQWCKVTYIVILHYYDNYIILPQCFLCITLSHPFTLLLFYTHILNWFIYFYTFISLIFRKLIC